MHSFNPSTTNKHEGSSACQVLEAPPSVSVPPNFASSVQAQSLVPQATSSTSLSTLEPNFHAKDRSLFTNIFKSYHVTTYKRRTSRIHYKVPKNTQTCNKLQSFVTFIDSLPVFLNNVGDMGTV